MTSSPRGKPGIHHRIIGIIDSNGAVHSRPAPNGECHESVFTTRMHKTWDVSCGKLWFAGLDTEDEDAIRRHLKRKYRLTPP